MKGRLKDAEMCREHEMTSFDSRDHITRWTVYSEKTSRLANLDSDNIQ